jgi:hypothetical protein
MRYQEHLFTGTTIPMDTDDLVGASNEPVNTALGQVGGLEGDLGSTEGNLLVRAREFRRESRDICDEFRRALQEIRSGHGQESATLRAFIDVALEDMVPISKISWTGCKRQVETRYCPLSDKAILGYVLTLLLDRSGGMAKHLRTCKLESCGNFFLSLPGPQGGGRQRYCRDSHRKSAAQQTGAARTRKWRESKKARESDGRARE